MPIAIEKRIHPRYKEFLKAKEMGDPIPQLFGKTQYFYRSEKGEISLIKLINYFGDGKDFWEIYCREGKLFRDVERFATKKEAEKFIIKKL
jgi:hypothetical protein